MHCPVPTSVVSIVRLSTYYLLYYIVGAHVQVPVQVVSTCWKERTVHYEFSATSGSKTCTSKSPTTRSAVRATFVRVGTGRFFISRVCPSLPPSLAREPPTCQILKEHRPRSGPPCTVPIRQLEASRFFLPSRPRLSLSASRSVRSAKSLRTAKGQSGPSRRSVVISRKPIDLLAADKGFTGMTGRAGHTVPPKGPE